MPRLISDLTELQMSVLLEALEFYQRFISGQVCDLPEHLRFRLRKSPEAQEAMRQLKSALFPELLPNESIGVGRIRDETEREDRRRMVAYEMYRQIYVFNTRRAKLEGKDTSMSVYDHPTMRYSGEPLIEFAESTKADAGDESLQEEK
jgi:hypothetical protein